MSVELPIELSAAQAHVAAMDDVNRWRGHCVECFARLELSMGEALESIASASPSAKRVPFTFGARVKALHAALAPPFPAPTRLLKTLQSANELLDQRNRIVHGIGKIWIDRTGNWAWAYRFNPAGKGEETGTYEQKSAERFEAELAKTSQSLCSQLQAIKKKVVVTE
jgi:hypothetical protein